MKYKILNKQFLLHVFVILCFCWITYPIVIPSLIVLFEPVWSPSMQNLLSQPNQTDESTQSAGHHKTAMKAVRGQILPTKYRKIIHSALRDQILLTKYTKNTIHSMVGGHILPTRNAQKTVLSASEARFSVQKYANKLRPDSPCKYMYKNCVKGPVLPTEKHKHIPLNSLRVWNLR